MKQWTTTLLVALFSITLLAGCGEKPAEGAKKPAAEAIKDSLNNFIAAIIANDLETVVALSGETLQKNIKRLIETKGIDLAKQTIAKEFQGELEGFTISYKKIKIENSRALCEFYTMKNNQTNRNYACLKFEDGKWLVTKINTSILTSRKLPW